MTPKHTFLFLLPFAFVVYSSSVSAQNITTFAGDGYGAATGVGGYSGDGGQAASDSARLYNCTGVAFDGAGNVYIADRDNNVVRKVSYLGIITTFAGTGTAGYSGDHNLANRAKLNKPYGVAVDVAGNVYIADYNNNVIRKVSTTDTITTYAGNGVPGYSGDGGSAILAELNTPQGIAIDQYGNIYVAEAGNQVIREITASGSISTVAGNGTSGYSGNGGAATAAQLNGPAGVTVDVYGNIYIADYFNYVVRKVDTNHIINNFAGNNTSGNSGDNGVAVNAQLNLPSGVSVYGHGNIFIADQGNNEIRQVDQSGIITRYAGTGTNGYSGDGGSALNAEFSLPKGLAVDGLQRVYVADYDNNVVRLISSVEGVNTLTAASSGLNVYPDPSNGSFTVVLPETTTNMTVTVMDITGRIVATKVADAQSGNINFNLTDMPAGSYFVKVNAGDKTYRQKVVIY